MFTKLIITFLFGFFTVFSFTACSKEEPNKANSIHQDVVTATIAGSKESPDPVLLKVQVLEKKGILTNVAVMESFPVEIKVTGPKNVINELKRMPRK